MGPLRSRDRVEGHSLIEAILASFTLVFAFFLVSRLFHTGLQYSRTADRRMAAVGFAEKQMAQLRYWARTTDEDWSTERPPNTDPSFPGYTSSLTLQDNVLYAPCTQLEAAYPSSPRRMPTISKVAVLRVSKPGQSSYTMSGVLTRGESAWPETADIRIEPGDATLTGPNEEVELTVTAYDEAGQEVKDLFFHWEIEPDFTRPSSTNPLPGTAEVRLKTRDGRKVLVRNRTRRRSGLWVATDGYCQAVAFCRYNGHYRRGSVDAQAACKIRLVAP